MFVKTDGDKHAVLIHKHRKSGWFVWEDDLVLPAQRTEHGIMLFTSAEFGFSASMACIWSLPILGHFENTGLLASRVPRRRYLSVAQS